VVDDAAGDDCCDDVVGARMGQRIIERHVEEAQVSVGAGGDLSRWAAGAEA